MSSLAFILNPLDRSVGSSCGSAAATVALAPNTPTPSIISGSALKRPLPRLVAAIAPMPSAMPDWAALSREHQHFLQQALAPLTTITAHRLALDTSHFATLSDPVVLQARKKQRRACIATSQQHFHNGQITDAHDHEEEVVVDDDDDDDDDDDATSPTTSSEGEQSGCEDADRSPDKPHASKKKTRLCKEKGCTSLAVSRRSCVRHGGGSRCTFEGCTNGAKLRNRCFQHGGSTICLTAGCASKAKRYGYCWSHGGGRICSTEGCVKVAAQGGSCWAHGGGNRCKLDGCSKRSYQKHGYYCKAHASHNIRGC